MQSGRCAQARDAEEIAAVWGARAAATWRAWMRKSPNIATHTACANTTPTPSEAITAATRTNDNMARPPKQTSWKAPATIFSENFRAVKGYIGRDVTEHDSRGA